MATVLSPVYVLLLAVVFAWAAGSKLRDPAAFRSVLQKLAPSGAALLTRAVPVLETALALFLLSGRYTRAASLAAALMLVIFSAALLRMHRLHVGGCGCFGERASGESVAQGLVRNALLLGAAAWVAVAPPVAPAWQGGASLLLGRLTVVTGLFCAWGCATGLVRSIATTRAMLRTRQTA